MRALQMVGTRSVLPAIAVVGGIGLLRRWSLGHGATDEERARLLPGDDQVPEPNLVSTRAISIGVSPARVWPWLVQLGQGRAGFYSYTALENLFGADIHNADRVAPQWQELAVGDQVNLAPGMPLDVVVVDPGHALVLAGGVPITAQGSPFTFSWAFVLLAQGDSSCRLVVRARYGYTRSWSSLVVEPTELVSFLMSQRMLRGIRDRAEHAPEGGERASTSRQVPQPPGFEPGPDTAGAHARIALPTPLPGPRSDPRTWPVSEPSS